MLGTVSAKERVRLYQTIATGAAAILTTAATLYGPQWPWLIPLSNIVSSIAAKLTGKPLPAVTQDQLARMSPMDVAMLTAAAVKAMQPDDADLAVMALRASLPPPRNVDVKLVRTATGDVVRVPWDSDEGRSLEADVVPHNSAPPPVPRPVVRPRIVIKGDDDGEGSG